MEVRYFLEISSEGKGGFLKLYTKHSLISPKLYTKTAFKCKEGFIAKRCSSD